MTKITSVSRILTAVAALVVLIILTVPTFAANAEPCEAPLLGARLAFTRVIAKAYALKLIALGELKTLSQSAAPYNPLARRAAEPAFANYRESLNQLLPSAIANWAQVRMELDALAEENSRRQADSSETRELTQKAPLHFENIRIPQFPADSVITSYGLTADSKGDLWISFVGRTSGRAFAKNIRTGKLWTFPSDISFNDGWEIRMDWIRHPGEEPELRLVILNDRGKRFQMATARLHSNQPNKVDLTFVEELRLVRGELWPNNKNYIPALVDRKSVFLDLRSQVATPSSARFSASHANVVVDKDGDIKYIGIATFEEIGSVSTTLAENRAGRWSRRVPLHVRRFPVVANASLLQTSEGRLLSSRGIGEALAIELPLEANARLRTLEFPGQIVSHGLLHQNRAGRLLVAVKVGPHNSDNTHYEFYDVTAATPIHLGGTGTDHSIFDERWVELTSGESVLFMTQDEKLAAFDVYGLNYLHGSPLAAKFSNPEYFELGGKFFIGALSPVLLTDLIEVHGVVVEGAKP